MTPLEAAAKAMYEYMTDFPWQGVAEDEQAEWLAPAREALIAAVNALPQESLGALFQKWSGAHSADDRRALLRAFLGGETP